MLSWVKFSKIPSAEALPQLLQLCPCSPGLAKGPAGRQACRLRHGQGEGQDGASPRRAHSPCSSGQREGTWVLPGHPALPCGLALPTLLPTVPLACSLFLWLPW